ncbi:hypothetical protein QZH41_018157, partial [Actinostola sp. cb2023]
ARFPPKEPQCLTVFWRNLYLIKHPFYISDERDGFFSEPENHKDFNGPTVGKAHVLAICTSRSAGVVQDHSTNAAATAATFAHEMGHNLGMGHDKEDCKCAAKKENQDCIMSGVARSVPAADWSSCSGVQFQEMLDKGLDSCLFNQPQKLYGDTAVCGNGFKEEGEDCDCGKPEECVKYGDNCCNSTTCKLLPRAECDEGPCCDKCKLKSSGIVCRDKVTECDLPEHCTGNSALGYCYEGICPTLTGQCEILWGDGVNSGPELCYTLNMRGSFHGSCRKFSNGSFARCKYKDIYCGMLHCANTKTDLPIIGTERNAYRYKWDIDGRIVECRSTSVDVGQDADDPGMAREGTRCGEEKVCISSQCLNITDVLQQNDKYNIKCPEDCSQNGICDNKGDCYCDDCWTGSDCSTSTPCLQVGARSGNSKLAAYLILVVLIIAALVAAVAAFVYRDKLKTKYQERKRGRERRYKSTGSASPSQPDNRYMPSVTTAPKPTAYPSKQRQPGKIELPSWPEENNTRRPPPGPPKRPSSPPVSSVNTSPLYSTIPENSYEILNRKPQPTFPVASVDKEATTRNEPSRKAILPPGAQSAAFVKPSDVKKAQGKPVKPVKPVKPPGRLPPPPPNRHTPQP